MYYLEDLPYFECRWNILWMTENDLCPYSILFILYHVNILLAMPTKMDLIDVNTNTLVIFFFFFTKFSLNQLKKIIFEIP